MASWSPPLTTELLPPEEASLPPMAPHGGQCCACIAALRLERAALRLERAVYVMISLQYIDTDAPALPSMPRSRGRAKSNLHVFS